MAKLQNKVQAERIKMLLCLATYMITGKAPSNK
jgi:hypothetical protein